MNRRPTRWDVLSIEGLSNRDLIAEIVNLADGGTTPARIATKLGATLSGIENRLKKAGRPDLATPFTTARAAERAATHTEAEE